MQSITARDGQTADVERASTRRVPWVAGVALVTFLLHGLTSGGYGYFRDEFYYLACSDRLAAGYVDHPPLSIWLLAGSRWLLGDSLLTLHLLPALATALLVWLTGHLTRVLGGGRWAQSLAAVAAAVAPVYLVVGNFYSMNAFEPLLWTVGALIVVHIMQTDDSQTDDPRWWLALGLVIGLGLENKHSMLFFGLGLSVAVVATPLRRHLLGRWVWLGALVALVLFLPNLLWQFRHGFPTLEFMRNAQLFKNAALSPAQFVGQQILMLHPLALPVWLAGLYWYFATPAGRRYRALGWIYLVVFALLVLQRGKAYYLAPAYPPLLAAGAIAIAAWTDRRARWLRSAYLALLLAGGIALAPLALPILPADTLVRYARALGVQEGVKAETAELGQLPQHFADMFGWSEMVDTVAEVYNRLPPEDRARCAIYAQNYGEAGAIDFLGRTHGLPHAISGHNNYWLWGPSNFTGEVVIVVGGSAADLAGFCETVEQVAVTHCRYCMPFENNRPIFLCRNRQGRLQQIWAQLKRYI
jgi:hypothetical protein